MLHTERTGCMQDMLFQVELPVIGHSPYPQIANRSLMTWNNTLHKFSFIAIVQFLSNFHLTRHYKGTIPKPYQTSAYRERRILYNPNILTIRS